MDLELHPPSPLAAVDKRQEGHLAEALEQVFRVGPGRGGRRLAPRSKELGPAVVEHAGVPLFVEGVAQVEGAASLGRGALGRGAEVEHARELGLREAEEHPRRVPRDASGEGPEEPRGEGVHGRASLSLTGRAYTDSAVPMSGCLREMARPV
jgi:hypothetical protein